MNKDIVNNNPATDMVTHVTAKLTVSKELKNLLTIAIAGEATKEWRQAS